MRSRSLKLISFLLLITIKGSAMADDITVSEQTQSEITALLAGEDAAWNNGSGDMFGERALPDIVFTNIVGMFSVGKSEFVARHQSIFSTIYKGSTHNQLVKHITLIKPDVAIVDTLAIVTGAERAPPGIPLIDGAIHARLEQVLVRRADGWWIASFHNVAVNPDASGHPSKP